MSVCILFGKLTFGVFLSVHKCSWILIYFSLLCIQMMVLILCETRSNIFPMRIISNNTIMRLSLLLFCFRDRFFFLLLALNWGVRVFITAHYKCINTQIHCAIFPFKFLCQRQIEFGDQIANNLHGTHSARIGRYTNIMITWLLFFCTLNTHTTYNKGIDFFLCRSCFLLLYLTEVAVNLFSRKKT